MSKFFVKWSYSDSDVCGCRAFKGKKSKLYCKFRGLIVKIRLSIFRHIVEWDVEVVRRVGVVFFEVLVDFTAVFLLSLCIFLKLIALHEIEVFDTVVTNGSINEAELMQSVISLILRGNFLKAIARLMSSRVIGIFNLSKFSRRPSVNWLMLSRNMGISRKLIL